MVAAIALLCVHVSRVGVSMERMERV